jgi:DNA-directed RNA polymerase specialized sigma24 family protein
LEQQELLSGLKRGKREGLKAFYAEKKAVVERACGFLLGDEEEAVQAVAETFRLAREQVRTKGFPIADLEPWLESLAGAACYPAMRQARQAFEAQTLTLEQIAASSPILSEITQDERERVSFLIRAELDETPEPHRQILGLHELEGLNTLELAKRLQCAWLSALKRLIQARTALAEKARDKYAPKNA